MIGEVWIYTPQSHKNSWRGQVREICLGPQAQALIRPFLKTEIGAYIFSPREAREQFNAQRKANRKTPMTPSHRKRKPKANPKLAPRDHYTVFSFGQAIRRACKKADVPHWHPHQLRHTRGTELRHELGIEMARVILGHKSLAATEIYAEKDLQSAHQIVAKLG